MMLFCGRAFFILVMFQIISLKEDAAYLTDLNSSSLVSLIAFPANIKKFYLKKEDIEAENVA